MKVLLETANGKQAYSDIEMISIMQEELTRHLGVLPNASEDFKMTKQILKEWYRKLFNERRALSYLNTKEATVVVNPKFIRFNSKARVIMGMTENDIVQIEKNGDVMQISFNPQGHFQMLLHSGSQGLWTQKEKQIKKLLESGIGVGKYVYLTNFGSIYHFKKVEE